MTAQTAGVKAQGRKVRSSAPFKALSRSGLVARGVIYVIVGALAVGIAFGDSGGKQADRQCALQTIAKTPGGTILLWLLAVGLFGMVLWRLSEAIYGQPTEDGDKATKRLWSLTRAVFYGTVCFSTVAFIIGVGGPGSSDKKSKDYTGKVMHDIPLGRWLVLIVGLGLVAGGIGIAVSAARTKFEKKLNTHQMSRTTQKVMRVLGVMGKSTRALVYAAAGVFVAYAAITFDPDKAKGIDGTLRSFAKTSFGPVLLLLVAAGLVTFGVYSFCEARWRRI